MYGDIDKLVRSIIGRGRVRGRGIIVHDIRIGTCDKCAAVFNGSFG